MSDLRSLPSVDDLSRSADLAAYPDRVRIAAARAAISRAREAIKAGESIEVSALARDEAIRLSQASLRPAINLSGVILHTGLGRARLAPEASAALNAVSRSHSLVELDEESGARGDRQEHVRGLLCELTGAEDALVVNNAAAGVFLCLTALASGREVILSRGQMVEIGGSFRLPDIVRQSGCRLVEVGCTNKTRLSDYERALTEETAAILRCHPSNFKIVGFTEEPALSELAALCHQQGLQLIDDQGSGCLLDLSRFGLPAVPTLPGSVAGGSGVSIASGDKLLGGPQAGLIVGKRHLIERIKVHPLARAVRVDKLTLSALEATLRLYAGGEESRIPTIKYLARTSQEVRMMANALRKAGGASAVVEEGITEVGGGASPGTGLPTFRTGIACQDVAALSSRLRTRETPIIGRIEDGRFWLDPRTLEREELPIVSAALRKELQTA